MSQPDDDRQEALKRLRDRLEAFDGGRPLKGASDSSVERGLGDGYRLLGELIGGILGGLGLGWVFDRVAHTTPLGLLAGLLLGGAAGVYAAVKTALQMGRRSGQPPAARED